jgi:flagellar biosynthetic protein FliQ
MDGAVVSTALSQMVDVAMTIAGPYLLVGLAVGLVMSLFQALTQLQEPSLVFVPKVLAVVMLMGLIGGWSSEVMVRYTVSMFDLFGTITAP